MIALYLAKMRWRFCPAYGMAIIDKASRKAIRGHYELIDTRKHKSIVRMTVKFLVHYSA